MRPAMRMLLANRDDRGGRYEARGNNYGDVNNRDWREPMADPESRFRDRRGREHYDDGRFAPMRGGLEIEGDVVFNRIPPVYDPRYRHDDGERMIGFGGGYPAHMAAPHDELAERRRQLGHAGHTDHTMDRQTAAAWVRQMHNSDGSTGEHWTYEQASQLMRQKDIKCDPAEFYATVNMLWSDYGTVARRIGQDNNDFWADMANAFLMDKDAKPNKLALYYECIAK